MVCSVAFCYPSKISASHALAAKFDVLRQLKDSSKWSVAQVVKVDFHGQIQRVMFHYLKTSSDCDEWVEFGSDRVQPLYSKTPKPSKTKPKATSQDESARETKDAATTRPVGPTQSMPTEKEELPRVAALSATNTEQSIQIDALRAAVPRTHHPQVGLNGFHHPFAHAQMGGPAFPVPPFANGALAAGHIQFAYAQAMTSCRGDAGATLPNPSGPPLSLMVPQATLMNFTDPHSHHPHIQRTEDQAQHRTDNGSSSTSTSHPDMQRR